MKNNKKSAVAVGAILLVAGIFAVSEKMSAVRPPEHRARFFPTLEERQITAIVVNDGGSGVRLEKRDGAWYVGDAAAPAEGVSADTAVQRGAAWASGGAGGTSGPGASDSAAALGAAGGFSPADSGLVQIALEKIVSLKKSEIASGNPNNQALFEVGDANKSFVEVYAGKGTPAGVLRVGKSGPDWNSNYARLTGSDTVYLIPGGLRQSLFFGIDRWRKKEAAAPDNAADSASANAGTE